MDRRSRNTMWVYLVLAAVGLVGTAYFNVRGVLEPSGSFLGAWFANPATTSLSIDLLVTARQEQDRCVSFRPQPAADL